MKKNLLILLFLLFLFDSVLKAQVGNTLAQEKYREVLEQVNTSKQYLTYGLIILVSVALLRIGAHFYMKKKDR